MFRKLKTGLIIYGCFLLLVALCMGLAEVFCGWEPSTTDEMIRYGFTFFGLICLGLDSLLPG